MKNPQGTKVTPRMRALIHELVKAEGIDPHPPSAPVIDRMVDAGTIIKLGRGELLIETGEIDPDFYILLSGVMRKWVYNKGIMVTSAFAEAGTQILDYHCYYAGLPSVDNIEACCKSTLVHIPRQAYDSLLRESVEFSNWRLMMSYNSHYWVEFKQRETEGNARDRYLYILRNRPEVVRNVPLCIIASYLGITPQYLSNLRRQLSLSDTTDD